MKVNIDIRIKRNGDYKFNIEAGGTYSNSVAFKTVLKVKNKKVYIIPLPHPSTANNKYWQENQCWEQLKELLKMCV
jgi:uracil-DNA glycosylase